MAEAGLAIPGADVYASMRVFPARTLHVYSCDCLEAQLDLGFSTAIRRFVLIEGAFSGKIYRADDAMRCAIMLLAGKRLLIQTDAAYSLPGLVPPLSEVEEMVQGDTQRAIRGRVYLAERVANPPAFALNAPDGISEPLVDVGLLMRWLREINFNINELKNVLPRGHSRNGSRVT